jgi:signal peptidase I
LKLFRRIGWSSLSRQQTLGGLDADRLRQNWPAPVGVWIVVRVVVAALAVAWPVALVLNRSLRRAQGSSMEPTLAHGQLVVVAPARWRRPRVGDVVVAQNPRGEAGSWIKRVGMIGPGVATAPHPVVPGRTIDVLVDDDQVLLLGDNPKHSTDGRHLGATSLSGVTHVVIWPTISRHRRT